MTKKSATMSACASTKRMTAGMTTPTGTSRKAMPVRPAKRYITARKGVRGSYKKAKPNNKKTELEVII